MRKAIFIICAILFMACKKSNNFTPEYNVPPQFQPYVSAFISEAAARGHQLTINNLIIKFDSALSPNYCAVSNIITARNDVQKIISINARVHCPQNNAQLETLLFHEMGHCILGRDHDKTLMPKGPPKSIMLPDDLTMYSPCLYAIGDSCNKLYRRSYYLDELFDPATPLPGWGK